MCFICAQRDPSDAFAGSVTHLGQKAPSVITDDPIWAGRGLVSETTDAAENTATTYRLEVGQSAEGTISSTSDEDWFAIDLVMGRSYDFRMLGLGGDFLSDPLIRLMNASGTEIRVQDDGFAPQLDTHQTDTAFSFTATYTGTYYIQADAYSTQTGSYLLSVTPDVAGTRPEFTVDEIAWQLINNGVAFFGETEAVAFNVGADNSLSVNITALSAEGQVLARAALDVWAAYLGINFVYVNSGAEITFDDDQDGAFASGVTSGGFITSASVNVSIDWLSDGTTFNSYAFETYIHEIGHALGLAHGGNYNGSATYGVDNYYVNDSLAWSIMSYMQAEGDDISSSWNTYVKAAFQDMYTPMIADILAVQRLYGISSGTFTGNTTYGFGGTTGIAAIDNAAATSGALMAMTIFDTGGIDTLDFSQTTAAQVISLASESLSSVLGGRHNVGIARGVVIENAISGGGDDLLVGNGAANELRGGNGNDTLNGGGGDDTLYGGAGDDYYVLSAGTDVIVDNSGRNGALSGTAIDLTISGLDALHNARVTGLDAANVLGNGLDNVLQGNTSDNNIDGGAGNDTLDGGAYGGDSLYGGIGADLIISGIEGDLLSGGDGVDVLSYANADGGVTVNLASNTASGAYALGDVISGFEGIIGSRNNDRLTGSAGENSLRGGGGRDVLAGGLGNDVFIFAAISDVTTNASATDVISDFKRGEDRIDLSIIDASRILGTDDAFVFRGTAAFGSSSAGEIRFQQVNNAGTRNDFTLVFLDNDADRSAEGVIKVMGLHSFTAGDFIL